MSQKKEYDLEKRTTKFAKDVINFCRKLKKDDVNSPMIHQIIKSGTSQAANYFEASESESKKDFIHKLSIANKEIKETKLWLELLAHANEPHADSARTLYKEAHELNLIFAKSIKTTKQNIEHSKIDN